ncbi:AAA family ATPase [Vibrio campbellii]|uniref:AAA family ATPase n=1 Tax=Vibrio campbellii TaxID=680 RepID=UPI0009A4BF78|nr:AAA family ATPase [Vibrio campbellii]OPH50849.1 hypothetical protein B4U81_16125 [Vibrio campbellii]
MLERIHRVRGIGLLHEADGRAQTFQKATFIYADNGRGKSTLASIFRSCSANNPSLIMNRRTIAGTNEPEAVLQFSHGQRSTFQNGSWDVSRPEILVFDADFVEQNVYAGGQVSTDQRKNLLKFALGASAVTAQQEYDQADQNWKDAASSVRSLTSQLSFAHQGLSITDFRRIQEAPHADEEIAELNTRIVEARNIGLIRAKAQPQLLQQPNFSIEAIIQILATSIANIDLTAEQQVRAHLEQHQKAGLERWISDGHAFGESTNCRFCNQALEGVELIQAYRSYFNRDYNDLKNNVSRLPSLISTAASNTIVDRLKAEFDTASAVVDGWQEHLELERPVFDEDECRAALSNIRGILESLKQQKESNLLEAVDYSVSLESITSEWQKIIHSVEQCNESINQSLELIAFYKENLEAIEIPQLEQQIKSLELAKIRYRTDIVEMLDNLSRAKSVETSANSEKQAKKDALNQVMQATLENYKTRINQLLSSFGAQFLIPNIDFSYRGGLRSDYSLEMRGANITLSGGVPDFKTSLSEGDKRTLAFAFFIASAEADPNLSDKIIIIDDPMCSLDLNRKQQTRTVLKRLYDDCEQLIIIAHDIHFLRNLRDDILRTGSPNHIKLLRLKAVSNRYSDFDNIDIDKECESGYFKCHRLLEEFTDGNAQSSMEIARSIRPMLEGYLHRRFPGVISSGLLFGEVVNLIANAQSPSPLVHAQNITSELNEINRYAGQFHHDTNPAADQVNVVDGELLGFVERAIRIVHAGVA